MIWDGKRDPIRTIQALSPPQMTGLGFFFKSCTTSFAPCCDGIPASVASSRRKFFSTTSFAGSYIDFWGRLGRIISGLFRIKFDRTVPVFIPTTLIPNGCSSSRIALENIANAAFDIDIEKLLCLISASIVVIATKMSRLGILHTHAKIDSSDSTSSGSLWIPIDSIWVPSFSRHFEP